jgi:hypothetical protein
VNDQIRDALAFARKVSPRGIRNLLTLEESYAEFTRETVCPHERSCMNKVRKDSTSYARPMPVIAINRSLAALQQSVKATVTN